MAFDSLRERIGDDGNVTPMEIAHHALFTPKEKIELLHQLKADVTGAHHEGKSMAMDADEIDAAIAEVRQGVQSGIGTDAAMWGDF